MNATASMLPPVLGDDQRAILEEARRHVDRDRLLQRCRSIVDVPSPTGGELPLARMLAAELEAIGCQAAVQVIDEAQGNAVGRLTGTGGGAELLLYAPIDTAFTGDPDEDEPWLGPRPRADFQVPARVENGKVIGLGAENPKSYVACILEALAAITATGATFPGSLVAGFGAGGMPSSGRPTVVRRNIGHGVGASYMLERGVRPDFAIIVKPGYAVAWEEVGLTWHRITVGGTLNYTGIRHRVPYRNPIVLATTVIEALERWFPAYAERHTSGLVAPQGSIGGIRAGSEDLSAFVPSRCELYLDIRVSPRATPAQVRTELEELLHDLRREHPDLDLQSEMTVAVDGTSTDPDNWIVRSLIRAWEAREGQPHRPATGTSGATDAAILRGHGIPTARIGPPPAKTPSPHPGFSMGVADGDSMAALVDVLLHSIVETATRSRQELGLTT